MVGSGMPPRSARCARAGALLHSAQAFGPSGRVARLGSKGQPASCEGCSSPWAPWARCKPRGGAPQQRWPRREHLGTPPPMPSHTRRQPPTPGPERHAAHTIVGSQEQPPRRPHSPAPLYTDRPRAGGPRKPTRQGAHAPAAAACCAGPTRAPCRPPTPTPAPPRRPSAPGTSRAGCAPRVAGRGPLPRPRRRPALAPRMRSRPRPRRLPRRSPARWRRRCRRRGGAPHRRRRRCRRRTARARLPRQERAGRPGGGGCGFRRKGSADWDWAGVDAPLGPVPCPRALRKPVHPPTHTTHTYTRTRTPLGLLPASMTSALSAAGSATLRSSWPSARRRTLRERSREQLHTRADASPTPQHRPVTGSVWSDQA